MSPAISSAANPQSGNPRQWTEQDLGQWLTERGLPESIGRAFEAHLVNGLLAVDLSKDDLVSMGVTDVLHQRRVEAELRELFGEAYSGDCVLPKVAAPISFVGGPPPQARPTPRRPSSRPFSARSRGSSGGGRTSPYLHPVPGFGSRFQRPGKSAPKPLYSSLQNPLTHPPQQGDPCLALTNSSGGRSACPTSSPSRNPNTAPTRNPDEAAAAVLHHSRQIAEADRHLADLAHRRPESALGCYSTAAAQSASSSSGPKSSFISARATVPGHVQGQFSRGSVFQDPNAGRPRFPSEGAGEEEGGLDYLKRELRRIEMKADLQSSRCSAMLSENEALRNELEESKNRSRCQGQEIESLRTKLRNTEVAYQELLQRYPLLKGSLDATEGSGPERRFSKQSEQELSIALWRASEFERRWRAADRELQALKEASQASGTMPAGDPSEVILGDDEQPLWNWRRDQFSGDLVGPTDQAQAPVPEPSREEATVAKTTSGPHPTPPPAPHPVSAMPAPPPAAPVVDADAAAGAEVELVSKPQERTSEQSRSKAHAPAAAAGVLAAATEGLPSPAPRAPGGEKRSSRPPLPSLSASNQTLASRFFPEGESGGSTDSDRQEPTMDELSQQFHLEVQQMIRRPASSSNASGWSEADSGHAAQAQ
eukprot:CAMPEP_0206493812 /NCGR_PEP_ID=MMETSP0324_2-20121206/47273_1 /ASSEMBLY_ACC=CAM_ASM_000836 /TAXON_ID=2866 /ORGANISM="Crypthecodinium cohnii, Strain Seligo" /LENGTH=651 /DNA_ID=CAMNT_0053977183 /DNA_START=26 /DNA_END=1981 /DNA_ORIENTATION=-